MINFEKPLHEFTEEELQNRINSWNPRFGALGLHELQRRQQKVNTDQISQVVKQISNLVRVTKTNAEISEQNSKSTSKLAWIAIGVALSGILLQTLVGLTRSYNCADFGNGEGHCYTWINLGPWTWLVSDQSFPN